MKCNVSRLACIQVSLGTFLCRKVAPLCNIAQKIVSHIVEYNEIKGDTLTLVYKDVILFLIVETRVWRFYGRKLFYF